MEESGKKCVWLAGRLFGGSEDDVNCLAEYTGQAVSWLHDHTVGRSQTVRKGEAWVGEQAQVQQDRLQYTYTDAVRDSRQGARDRDPTVQFPISDSEAGKKGVDATKGAVATMATIGGGIGSASKLLDEAAAGAEGGAATNAAGAAPRPIGYAPGTGASAFTPNRLQHASRHLTEAGILPNWSKATGQKFVEIGTQVLENPTATFDHELRGGETVKGFLGQIQGQNVAFLVYKTGPHAGQIATSIIPSPQTTAQLGHKMKTRNALGIFWNGEEMDGFLLYGLWPGNRGSPPAFPSEMWPAGTELKQRKLWGSGWTVWLWEIRLHDWPEADDWRLAVTASLDRVCASGALVSWCAVEGCFVEPPDLFDPKEMSGCLWACLSQQGIAHAPPPLDGEFAPVGDDVLGQLHEQALSALYPATHDTTK